MILTLLILASACATGDYRPMTLPNGKAGFRVSCINDKQPCYDKAREACNGNYEIITDSRVSQYTSELLVECKK